MRDDRYQRAERVVGRDKYLRLYLSALSCSRVIIISSKPEDSWAEGRRGQEMEEGEGGSTLDNEIDERGIFRNGKFNVVNVEIISRKVSSVSTHLAVKFICMI